MQAIGACCVTAEAETSIEHLLGLFFPPSATIRPLTTTPNNQLAPCSGTPIKPVTEATVVAVGSESAGVVCGAGPTNSTVNFEESKIVGGKPAVPNSWPFMVLRKLSKYSDDFNLRSFLGVHLQKWYTLLWRIALGCQSYSYSSSLLRS